MTPGAILATLVERGVTVTAARGRLVLDGPAAALTPDLVAEAKAQHDRLVALLRADPTRCLHCLGLLRPPRVATCDGCLLAQLLKVAP